MDYPKFIIDLAERLGCEIQGCKTESELCERFFKALGIIPGPDEDIGIEMFEHLLCCGEDGGCCDASH